MAKSTRKQRRTENIDIFDFGLGDDEMSTIDELDTNKSLFFDHQTPEAGEMFVNFVNVRRNQE